MEEETKWFYIGINFGEAQVLKEYLRYSLNLIFAEQDFARVAAAVEKKLAEAMPAKVEPKVESELNSPQVEESDLL